MYRLLSFMSRKKYFDRQFDKKTEEKFEFDNNNRFVIVFALRIKLK